ncbi:DUF5655 domain-containing protein [Glutamicibacter nicotianae]|uniref:DUF5655 domain-containing protein n=1 Tax=Glutamicibacter nicotianae TaxID=37929 RepID=UPI00255397D9|nr:DUF5655 domain-containing protein [Glutamicibacter nicotianae]WIV42918.1 DUF5655 domain-containing protein [Glutamicibacter nicotianae]
MEASQQNPRSWQEMRQWQVELLEHTTGQSLEAWNELVRRDGPAAEKELRAWLAEHSVTGYSQMLLVFERFGYPDFFTRSADELVQGQYADRPQLREIYDAVLALLPQLGEVAIQTRKTYVALLTARRTFAVIAPVTRTRVDLGLRWEAAPDSPRFSAPGSRLGSAVTVKAGLRSAGDVDDELIGWLQQVYDANL